MATNHDAILTWTFMSKCEPSKDILEILTDGEQILQCYKTIRDIAALTNKRLIVRDAQGFTGKKVYIGHNFNETGANRLKEMILAEYPECVIDIQVNHALNCFYAELGGILVGFEGQ